MFIMCNAVLTHVEIPRVHDRTTPLNWTMTAWPSWATSTSKQNRFHHFYRAMHYCIARYWDCMSSVCLSVRLSVSMSVMSVNQDDIGWRSWKLIARTLSPTSSLFVAQRPSTYSQGNMGKLGETRGGVVKSGVLEHKSGNISETRKDRGNVTMDSL